MNTRKDGEETRQNILEAACHVFGQKGFRDATNAQICEKAGANIAAINYHFRSKSELYRAAWKLGVDEARRLYPVGGSIDKSASPEEKIRGHIRAVFMRQADTEHLGFFHRIRMAEMFSPTGLIDDLIIEIIQENKDYTIGVLREMLGPDATEMEIELCVMSIISQCLFKMRSFKKPPHDKLKFSSLDATNNETFLAHIIRFSLAGIEATRKNIVTRSINKESNNILNNDMPSKGDD